MDLDTIIMHLDNFVDTWNGWSDVLDGFNQLSSVEDGQSQGLQGVVDAAKVLSSASSTEDTAQ